MRIFLALLFTICFGIANGQTTIKPGDVSQHIGDSVTVCGKVAGMRYFGNSRNQPTFLNIGADFPNQQVTVVIWGEVRKLFSSNVDELKGKEICITGRITMYKERPQIVINQPADIRVQ